MTSSYEVEEFCLVMFHNKTSVKKDFGHNYKVKRKRKVHSSSSEKLKDHHQQKRGYQSECFLLGFLFFF